MINLIPQPQHVKLNGDKHITDVSGWHISLQMPSHDNRLIMFAQSIFGEVILTEANNNVYAVSTQGLTVNPRIADRIRGRHEGYVLTIDEDHIEIYALSASGLYYGMTTLVQLQANCSYIPALTIVDWADLQLRSEYLDLRTVYPTFDHIIEYVAQLSSYKINTLIVEYEDKLPFNKLGFLRHPDYGLTNEQHQLLLNTAHEHYVQIIPKQQSFGHLEYVLKHEPYIHLREAPEHVGEICPHRPGSYEIIAELLEEIASLHPNSSYLHMGCDEVWSLGICDDCLNSGLTRELSFIQFVNRLVEKVCSLGKIPMIWHDMLVHATEEELSQLDQRVVVVVWIYGGFEMKSDARHIINRLRHAGIAVMGASAVRCWDDNGEQNYPVIHNRIPNLLNWVEIAQSEQLDGIINTNWATPFSLGSPYGLFETSRYPAFFAADHNWNARANVANYLSRFMNQFHGVSPTEYTRQQLLSYEVTDYYQAIPRLLPLVTHNRLTAELIDVMIQYELPAKRRFPLHTFLFRGELSEGSEEVLTGLKQKYQLGYQSLALAKQRMQEVLNQLLPTKMAEMYIESRFYLFDLYEAKLNDLLTNYAKSDKESEPNV